MIYDKDNPDWCPNQKVGHNYSQTKTCSLERYNRTVERIENRRRSESAIALLELNTSCTIEPEPECEPAEKTISRQSDLESKEIDFLYSRIDELDKENASLKDHFKKYRLEEETFQRDDEKTPNYTGLPNWQLLLSL